MSIGPSADPEPTSSQATPIATPAATPVATPEQSTPEPTTCCETSPVPSQSQASGLAASDHFWAHWYETCWFGAFDIVSSLEEITSKSDLVVRGRITDLDSRKQGPYLLAYVKVLITEVLKGEPVPRDADTVEVQIGSEWSSDLQELRLPAHDHLWFLVLDENGHTYYTTDYEQVSVLRDIDGVVEVIMPDAIANAFSRRHFPVPLDGTSFEDLVDQVRQLVEGQSAALYSYATRSLGDEPDPRRIAAC